MKSIITYAVRFFSEIPGSVPEPLIFKEKRLDYIVREKISNKIQYVLKYAKQNSYRQSRTLWI